MNVISDTAEYALRAAVWLAQNHAAAESTGDHATAGAERGHATQEPARAHALAGIGRGHATQEIARGTQTPPDYLAKVLKQMARAGLLTVRRGAGGGFSISRPATEISVLEIINAVDPLERIHSCPLNRPEHCKSLCPLHRRIDNALQQVEEAFASATLADLL